MHGGGRPGAYVGGRLGAQAPRMRSRIGTIESAAAGGGGGGGCGGPGKDASLPRVGGAGLEARKRRPATGISAETAPSGHFICKHSSTGIYHHLQAPSSTGTSGVSAAIRRHVRPLRAAQECLQPGAAVFDPKGLTDRDRLAGTAAMRRAALLKRAHTHKGNARSRAEGLRRRRWTMKRYGHGKQFKLS